MKILLNNKQHQESLCKTGFIMICVLFMIQCKQSSNTTFQLISESKSGIKFNNIITETDSLNILDYEYLYNGGGVAIADFDNDGLEDVFFTGNIENNALYKNLGDLKFKDVSSQAKIEAVGRWCTGVSLVDINQDGKKDIYVTTSKHNDPNFRKNLLFINTSDGKNISFSEQAAAYGIADTSYTMNAVFFDYDNDSDLDLLIINNKMAGRNNVVTYKAARDSKIHGTVDKLFRNDFDTIKGHPYFTDVSDEAGIIHTGYSLGVNICDINQDGWKDIYISNDFISNDLLYINNGNGTFTNQLAKSIKHTAFSSMGVDIADINNDGLMDIVALDMMPESNYRKKTMLAPNNYNNYLNNLTFGYTHQYVRNVLQLNRGPLKPKDNPVFSEIAMMAGIDATDWSWSPLVADFDNDGLRDIIITNGFPKDITDRDFMEYKANYGVYIDKAEMLKFIPEVKLTNYAYKNKGNLSFENITKDWGITKPSFSNGAAYSDLDNDGDLDYITNNINDLAHLYENKTNSQIKKYLKINIKGSKPNLDGIGTKINYNGQNIKGTYEHSPSRGYLSTVSEIVHLGLGDEVAINLEITWPNGKKSMLKSIQTNQTITIDQNNIETYTSDVNNGKSHIPIFSKVEDIISDTCFHNDHVDYNIDPLLIKKLSNLGQGIAIRDINNDGFDDFYITGSLGYHGRLYLSNDEKYTRVILQKETNKEETSAVFLDIDNDNDYDLFIGCGFAYTNKDNMLTGNVLLRNDNGVFVDISDILPKDYTITTTVKTADYDADGDIDIFVGKGHKIGHYPMAAQSYILINESKTNICEFKKWSVPFDDLDILVNDALWSDFDGDHDLDLLVVGDYTGICIFENQNGSIIYDKSHALNQLKGFWNTISGADLDGDGDTDYVVGNLGLNNILRPSLERPFRVYAKDFDNNESYDFIPTTYFLNTKQKWEETPYHVKGDLIKEMNSYRKQYLFYRDYALSPLTKIINPNMMNNALIKVVNTSSSIILINSGNKKFIAKDLPKEAQMSPIFGIVPDDFNQDGNVDLLFQGNNYGVELGMGRMDAGLGGLLINKGNLNLEFQSPLLSGFIADGEYRSLTTLFRKGKPNMVSTQVDGPLEIYALSSGEYKTFVFPKNAINVTFYDQSDKIIYLQENYLSDGYKSQSSLVKRCPQNTTKAKFRMSDKSEIIKSANEI
jgi:enediyne biosynthesis protein E4